MYMYMYTLQVGAVDGVVETDSDVHTQELAAKISENAQLHIRVRTLTHTHVQCIMDT